MEFIRKHDKQVSTYTWFCLYLSCIASSEVCWNGNLTGSWRSWCTRVQQSENINKLLSTIHMSERERTKVITTYKVWPATYLTTVELKGILLNVGMVPNPTRHIFMNRPYARTKHECALKMHPYLLILIKLRQKL